MSESPAETRRLGQGLGHALQPGAVVSLEGELGAGKTCLVQGLARGLGVPKDRSVRSPSFTIINEHPGRARLYHVDLYRIQDAAELGELGLEECFDAGGVTAVEWLDRFPHLKPPDHLQVRFEVRGPKRRAITISATGPRARAALAALKR
jgi:tRNA threonylcarbamoyladenosine biosynthesis protein TsaE